MSEQNILTLGQIIQRLLEINTPKILAMIRNLNSKYEYASLAQELMRYILPKLDMIEVSKACFATGKDDKTFVDLPGVLESVELYNQKHYQRMDRQLSNSYFVDYLVSQMTLQEDLEEETKVQEPDTKMIGKKRKRSFGDSTDLIQSKKKRRKSKEMK